MITCSVRSTYGTTPLHSLRSFTVRAIVRRATPHSCTWDTEIGKEAEEELEDGQQKTQHLRGSSDAIKPRRQMLAPIEFRLKKRMGPLLLVAVVRVVSVLSGIVSMVAPPQRRQKLSLGGNFGLPRWLFASQSARALRARSP